MKPLKILHSLSYLRWVFFVWMMLEMIHVFFFNPANPIQSTGNVLFIAGFMLGFASLSDITKMTEKERKSLLNPKTVKKQFFSLFCSLVVLTLISSLFFSLKFIFPDVKEAILSDFTKLGFDCLVMLLGMLGSLKQFVEKVEYARSKSVE